MANQNRNSYYKGKRKGKGSRAGKGKETEINVPDSAINVGDLPHVVTDSKESNDFSWYTHIYPAYKSFASLSFANMAGLALGLYNSKSIMNKAASNTKPNTQTLLGQTVPGIMTFELAPTLGNATGPTAAINIASQQLITLLRAKNSGQAKNYDPAEPIMLIQSMDSAYMLYEELCRAYKLMTNFNYENRYVPNELIKSLGFSPELAKSKADFEGMLDLFAYQLASFNIPDQFDFIKRHSWLFAHVYKDHDSSKAQLYAYKPAGFYVWTEGTESRPTYLKYVSRNTLYGISNNAQYGYGIVTSLDQIQNAIDSVMVPLLGSTDVGYVTGDMRRAFEAGGMIQFRPIEDHATLAPVYDREVLLQMANMKLSDRPVASSMDITVNNSNTVSGPYLVQSPEVASPSPSMVLGATRNHILNYDDQEPTPEMNMVATRLMFNGEVNSSADQFNFTSLGTEICVGCRIYVLNNSFNGSPTSIGSRSYEVQQDVLMPISSIAALSMESTAFEDFQDKMMMMSLISNFDWHPAIYTWATDNATFSSATNMYIYGVMTDMNDYSVLGEDNISKLNEIAVMSEYAARDFGTGVSKS